ncbi:hypothetical protein QQ045_031679 [Rhodiola kirilowii]
MPKKKLAAAGAALHCVKKKLRSNLPLRRPRTHFNSFLSNVVDHHRHRRSSSSSASPLLCCDEQLHSVDDSSRITVDDCPKSPRYRKSCSNYAAVDAVSESSSCIESCSVVGESVDAAVSRNQLGLSTVHHPAASELDVTSHEQLQQPQSAVQHMSPSSSGKLSSLKPTVDEDDDNGVSIVEEGGLVSPNQVSFTNILDCSSSEQESDFSPSMYLDSGTDFSERSADDSSPSLTYSWLIEYRRAFQKSTHPAAEDVSSHHDETAWLRFEHDKDEEECYLSLRSRERRQAYIHDYTQQARSLIKQRLQIVHWIIEQSATKELHKETMFLGVNLLDRFLSNGNFKNKRNIQIVGIACLTLATRIEENQIYNSVQQSTFHMGCNAYSRSEVVAMEWLVQEVLNFKCFLPTIYNFLSFYLKVARADITMSKNAEHLAELALLEPEQLSYWPSTVAASLVILSSLPSNQYLPHICVMKAHLRSEDDNIDECVKSLSLSLKKY